MLRPEPKKYEGETQISGSGIIVEGTIKDQRLHGRVQENWPRLLTGRRHSSVRGSLDRCSRSSQHFEDCMQKRAEELGMKSPAGGGPLRWCVLEARKQHTSFHCSTPKQACVSGVRAMREAVVYHARMQLHRHKAEDESSREQQQQQQQQQQGFNDSNMGAIMLVGGVLYLSKRILSNTNTKRLQITASTQCYSTTLLLLPLLLLLL